MHERGEPRPIPVTAIKSLITQRNGPSVARLLSLDEELQ